MMHPKVRRVLTSLLALGIVGALLLYVFSSKVRADVTIDSVVYESIAANITGSRVVFTSDQVGYAFYQDIPNANEETVVYSKTTNGGTTWGSPVTVDSQIDTLGVSVWYDRWTPGDTTGNYIYIVTRDDGSDDLWYNRLDTSGDTLQLGSSPVSISSSPGPNKTNLFSTGPANESLSVSKATDGVLFVGIEDSTGGYVLKCSATCNTNTNWSDAGTNPMYNDDEAWEALLPLASGNMMLIHHHENTDDLEYKTWNGTAWSGSWTDIVTPALEVGNVTHDSNQMGVTLDKTTNDIYLVYCADNPTLGTDDDIRTAIYSGGAWTAKTDVLTNDSKGLYGAKIAIDENNGDLYAVYTALTTPATITTGNVYWKKSTDDMTTWGAEQGPINTGAEEINSTTVTTMSNERIYATWNKNNGAGADTSHGHTVADPTSNTTPAAPTLILPTASQTGVGVRSRFELRTTDAESDYVKYKIEVCTTSNCSAVLRTIDQTSSQTGWASQNAQSATAYTASTTIGNSAVAYHFYQDPELLPNTQYWWRAYAIDPAGTNIFSGASSIQTFTTGIIEVRIQGGVDIRGGTKIGP